LQEAASAAARAFAQSLQERAINCIEMVYKSKPSFKGLATVCLEGLD
jgi:hypothetical protein